MVRFNILKGIQIIFCEIKIQIKREHFFSISNICVAFEGFVLYPGGDYTLYPNIMLLAQVMAYVMSGTLASDKVRHLTCAPESGPLIGSPIRTIRPGLGRQGCHRVSLTLSS